MERHSTSISVQVERARHVGILLQRLGWLVAALGVVGIVTYSVLWAVGEIDADQGVSLILGTSLAVLLSGTASYGAGVNIGLGAERLALAAKDAPGPASWPASPARDRG